MSYCEDFDDEETPEIPACAFCDHDEGSTCCKNCSSLEGELAADAKPCKCRSMTKEQQEKLTPPTSYLDNLVDCGEKKPCYLCEKRKGCDRAVSYPYPTNAKKQSINEVTKQ